MSPLKRRSPTTSQKRKVDFNLGEDEEKKASPPRNIDTKMQNDIDQKKLNMDPSSAVIDVHEPFKFAEELEIS